MSNFTDFLINALADGVETVGESKLVDLLQELHDNNPTQYKAAIEGGKALVSVLQPIVSGTKTKIDDAIINALSEALNQSAIKNAASLVETLDDKGGETPTTPPKLP